MNQPAKKPAVSAPGVEVGGCVLKEKLGAGSFGTVFVAEQDGRLLAVKLIQVKHPNAARLRGCVEPIPPSKSRRVVVEAEPPTDGARGPHTLKLWEAGGTRTVTLGGVTFP